MKLIKIKEVSEILNIKETTLYSWAKSGLIPAYKLNGLWRFDMEEIEKWMKRPKLQQDNLSKPLKKARKHPDIDRIVKKAIDEVKDKGYNFACGKPGRDQGLGKGEEENGTL